MKRTILCSAFTVAAIAAAVATQSAFAVRAPSALQVAEEGAECTDSTGRSGYMVSTGRGGYVCIASPGSI